MPFSAVYGGTKLPKLRRLWNAAGKCCPLQQRALQSPLAGPRITSHLSTSPFVCNALPWRPRLDDVERISRGDAAKVRGTGSRMVPHRLNQEERKLWEFAKKKGFLTVRGTGYRKERKGAPLANSWRQYCDAKEVVCVVIEQDKHGGALDTIVVDVSTLRLVDPVQVLEAVQQLLEPLDVTILTEAERPLTEVPFTVIPAEFYEPPSSRGAVLELNVDMRASAETSDQAEPEGPVPSLEEAMRAVEMQASVIRNLKSQGLGNKDPAVVAEVATLLQLKEQLKLAEAAAALQQVLEASTSDTTQADRSSTTQPSSDDEDTACGPCDGDADGTSTHTQTMASSSPAADSGVFATRPQDVSQEASTSIAPVDSSSPGIYEDVPNLGVEDQVSTSGTASELPKDHPLLNCAIWQIPSQPLFVRAARPVAKEVAAFLVAELPKKLKPLVLAYA